MTETNSYDLSVIVICGNNSQAILDTDSELTEVLISLGLRTELIYVDNGSIDDTQYRLRQRLAEKSPIPKKLVILRRNFGASSTFIAGTDHSQGRFILTTDAELLIDPIEIPRMIEAIEMGYDLVVGERQRQHLSGFVRLRSSVVNQITSWVTGVKLKDYGSTFRMFRREIIPDLKIYGELYHFAPVFASQAGARISEIPVAYRPNYYQGREYTASSLWTSFWDLVTVWFLSRYALRPIYVFGSIGSLLIISAFMALSAAFINRAVNAVSLIETPLPVLAANLFTMGILTILLGLTTEIVIRGYFEAQGKPFYSIREVISS